MLNLNSLPSLETLSAVCLCVSDRDSVDGRLRRNKTIKHIEVKSVNRRSTDGNFPESSLPLHRFTDFFLALESVTVSPPKENKMVYDRNTFNDLRVMNIGR